MRPATRCGLCTPAPAQICGWLDATAAPRPLVFFFSAASCDRRLSSLSYRRFLCTNGSIGATARRGGGGGVCLYIQTPPSLWGTIAASLSAMLLPLGHPQRVENRLRHGALQPPLKEGRKEGRHVIGQPWHAAAPLCHGTESGDSNQFFLVFKLENHLNWQ